MPQLPEWQPLDEIGASVSGGGDGGRIVGIVASEEAVSSGWAEDAAVVVAKAWSGAGRKVVIVDGALQEPRLHAVTGVENGEGLSDATLFGASVGRVARLVEDGSFFVITAGTAVADTDAVVRSRRWGQLSKGFVEAGVTLGVFLRDGDEGAAAFLGSASEIVVLSGPYEGTPAVVRDLEPLVKLVTGQEGAGTPAAPDPADVTRREMRAVAPEATASPSRLRVVLLVLVAVILLAVLLGLFGVVTITPRAGLPTGAPAVASAIGSVGG